MDTQAKFPVNYHTTEVDGLAIFHREAGDPARPTILFLGGFPSGSYTFDGLIEQLKDEFHVVAPDYPGFGHSSAPAATEFEYSFAHLTDVIEHWIDQVGLTTFALYTFDYGGPIGFRLAARRPELIAALIVQNANAYQEGIGPGFAAALPFLQNRNAETEIPARALMTAEGVNVFYLTGIENKALVNPDHAVLDTLLLRRPGLIDAQLDLLQNYTSNIAEYPVWQAYFRTHQPRTLLVWGKNDPFFPEAAARAFLTDLPQAELHLYNTSHFALEEYGTAIANDIRTFLRS